jgi:hypothetical protein
MTRSITLLAVALLLGIPGCRHHQEDDETYVKPAAPVTVQVTNNFALPVEIFARGSGTVVRLGTVHPGMNARFVVPPAVLSTTTVELEAHASSTSRVGRSGPMLLAPGVIVDFTVTSAMFNSTADIRE